MRYYKFILRGNEEKIKELIHEKEFLYDYKWLHALCAVNSYMYHIT